MKATVLDTSAFIQGYNPGGTNIKNFTVPIVRTELRGNSKTRFDNSVTSGVLKLVSPEDHYVDMVENSTTQMGESDALSKTDKNILALGLQLDNEGYDPIIVSEDYAVQNMARELGINYQGLATPGIKKKIKWEIYCPGCRRTFKKPQPEDICKICGTKLKRRPRKKLEH
jgi:UPF0271 protein